MSREVRRVPLGFGWPLSQTWPGFVQPDWLDEASCPDCARGYSPRAEELFRRWYGYVPFDPVSEGSSPFPADHPAIRARAERNAAESGEAATRREARRLADLFNSEWMHHLSQADVDVLVAAVRLTDLTHRWERGAGWQPIQPPIVLTAAQVNAWSIGWGFGHDSINAGVVIEARCDREGVSAICSTCAGQGSLEKFAGQRAAAESWQPTPPPTGDAWQVWETVSEGSPVTPAFETPEALAWHLVSPTLTQEDALAWITGPGWAPSMISSSAGFSSNIEAGVALMREAEGDA